MSAGFSCPSLRSIFLVQYFNWKLPQKVKSAGFSCPVLLPEIFFKSKFQSKTSRSWSLQEFFVHLYIRKYFPVQYFTWKLPEVQVCRVLHSIFVFEKKSVQDFNGKLPEVEICRIFLSIFVFEKNWLQFFIWKLPEVEVCRIFLSIFVYKNKFGILVLELKTCRSWSLHGFPVHEGVQKYVSYFNSGAENLHKLKSTGFSCPFLVSTPGIWQRACGANMGNKKLQLLQFWVRSFWDGRTEKKPLSCWSPTSLTTPCLVVPSTERNVLQPCKTWQNMTKSLAKPEIRWTTLRVSAPIGFRIPSSGPKVDMQFSLTESLDFSV